MDTTILRVYNMKKFLKQIEVRIILEYKEFSNCADKGVHTISVAYYIKTIQTTTQNMIKKILF
jgi:hypothetical protein